MAEESETKKNFAHTVPSIRAVLLGVGTRGDQMVHKMKLSKMSVERIFMDTDRSALDALPDDAGTKVLLGESELHGIGTGTDESRAEHAAQITTDEIISTLRGVDLLFIVTALGRGTGSGATPVIAKIAQGIGITTICFATIPFSLDGPVIANRAMSAVKRISEECNAFVAIEDDLITQVGNEINYTDGYKIAREWIEHGIEACGSVIFNSDAETKIDLPTFKHVFPVVGAWTLFTIGEGKGPAALEDAVTNLSKNPLLKTTRSIQRAETLIFHLQVSSAPSLQTITDISNRLQRRFGGQEFNIPSFTVIPELGDGVRICLIGAGGLENARFKKSKISEAPKDKGASGEEELFASSEVENTPQDVDLLDESTIGMPSLYKGVNLDRPTFIRLGKKPEDELKKIKR